MASFLYNKGVAEMLDGTIDIDTDTIKMMLVDSTYSPDKSDEVVDDGTSSDAASAEISVTGYTAGWGGAGRKTCAITLQENDTDDRVDIAIDDLTWNSLGAGATIVGAVLIKEGGANDTTSRLLAYFDITNTATSGGNVTLDFTALGSGGNIRISL